MSWAAATRSIRECKMRIERIRGSCLDTDSKVWGVDQTTWELMWVGEAAMRKNIPVLRQAGYESISDLPRIQQTYKEKALVVVPPVMTPVAGLIFETKNRAIFLERFFGRGISGEALLPLQLCSH